MYERSVVFRYSQLFPCTVPTFPSSFVLFFPFFPPGIGRFGALRRSSELISVLEIPFDSLCLGEMTVKGCQEIDYQKMVLML